MALTIFALVLLLILTVMVLLAFGFNRYAAFMPLVIGIPATILAAVNFIGGIKNDKTQAEQDAAGDVNGEFSWWAAHRDEVRIWAWILALLVLVVLFGILWGGGIFVFIFLLLESRQKIYTSLLITLILELSIYGFLYIVMGLKLYPGILF